MYYAVNLIELSKYADYLSKIGLTEKARILSEYVSIKLGII